MMIVKILLLLFCLLSVGIAHPQGRQGYLHDADGLPLCRIAPGGALPGRVEMEYVALDGRELPASLQLPSKSWQVDERYGRLVAGILKGTTGLWRKKDAEDGKEWHVYLYARHWF